MEKLTSSDIDDLLDADSTNSQKIVKFIVYCHSQLCEKFLSQPFDFGRKHVRRNYLLHLSRWIVVIFHEDEHHQFEGNPNTTFDDVAVIRFFSVSENQKQNHKMKSKVLSSMAQMDSSIRLLFATEAYSMGTDAPDIRRVIHAGVPSTMESS
ncbi:unnamed protein product [Mytilus edulis]|uniref:Helicase C-terminal domain-containing protein n=1 Tax=Mytilus edulis TaxID=6550 RepID=A0A8S3TR32_MYTED|nr:unnamed protein product [Mytilus edulis]